METSEDVLVRIANILDEPEFSAGLAVSAQHMERAFCGSGAVAMRKAEASQAYTAASLNSAASSDKEQSLSNIRRVRKLRNPMRGPALGSF